MFLARPIFNAVPPTFVFNTTIASNTTNYDIYNAAIGAGWDQVKILLANVVINSGVYIGSTSTSAAFVVQSSFPTNSTIKITNNGNILGIGGNGGNGSQEADVPPAPRPPATAGTDGGLALQVLYPTTIDNLSGVVAGGGGGGGGAGAITDPDTASDGGDGGGGQGYNGGIRGQTWFFAGPFGADNGSPTAAGNGGTRTSGGGFAVPPGGNGGALATAGSVGDSESTAGKAGGNPGDCTSGNANITWLNNGTRLGNLN